MEFSDIGYGIGAVVGMILVNIILRIFIPTYLDTTAEKWIRRVGCVLVVVICTIVGGFLGRTELKTGDYSHKTCSEDGCGKPSVCVFHYFFRKAYFCEDHMVLVYEFVEPEDQESQKLRDSYGNDQYDAWEMAKRIVREKLNLPADAEFVNIGEARISVSNTGWEISGEVAIKDDSGNTKWTVFHVSFMIYGSGYNLWSFKSYI